MRNRHHHSGHYPGVTRLALTIVAALSLAIPACDGGGGEDGEHGPEMVCKPGRDASYCYDAVCADIVECYPEVVPCGWNEEGCDPYEATIWTIDQCAKRLAIVELHPESVDRIVDHVMMFRPPELGLSYTTPIEPAAKAICSDLGIDGIDHFRD